MRGPAGVAGWLAGVLLVTTVLAVVIYLFALWLGQTLEGREFAAALASDLAGNRPIILFLRSFGIAQSSLGAKFKAELGSIMGLGTQTGIASITGDTVGSVGRRYEVEENLDDAIGLNAMFVPIGDRLASYGAAKITVKEEDWQKTFARLASASQLIFMMPGPSASALWELSQIMQSRKLLEKTVFIMPPESSSSEQRNPLAQFARSPGIDRSVPGLWKRVGEMAKIRAGCSLDVQLGRALESDIGDVP